MKIVVCNRSYSSFQNRIMSSGVAHAPRSVSNLRLETPGCEHVVHLNNAGCSLPCRRVIEATQEFYRKETLFGGYEVVETSEDEIRKPYVCLAQLLNCQPDEIAVLPSATSAWQQVVFGIDFKPGDVVLTTPNEYGSNYINFLQIQRRSGIKIVVIPETTEGGVDLDALENLVTELKPKLISVTHVPSSSGPVYDAVGIGRIAREHSVLYLLDACQSVGQVKVDVQEIGCDFLSATSRKFLRGPRGIGFLYAAERTRNFHEPALLDNRSAEWASKDSYVARRDAMRYEQYEINYAAKVGFGVAVEYCLELGMDWISDRVKHLADYLRNLLRQIPHVHVWDRGAALSGIVSFTIENQLSDDIERSLIKNGINVAVSGTYATRIKMEEQNLESVVRASVHYYNTEEELEKCAAVLNNL